MKSPARRRLLPAATLLAAAARDLDTAAAAIAAGADLIDLTGAGSQTVTAVRGRYPGVLTGAVPGRGGPAGGDAAALGTGTVLICPDIGAAGQAAASGRAPGSILVEAAPARAPALIAAGWQVLVAADDADPHAAAAVAALSAWLGAAAVRVTAVRAARRAIDMTSSIRGTRPIPAGYARP